MWASQSQGLGFDPRMQKFGREERMSLITSAPRFSLPILSFVALSFFLLHGVALCRSAPFEGIVKGQTSYFRSAQPIHIPLEKLTDKKPPEELKLTSILYELAVTSDKERFAKEHNIDISEGKVRIFVFLDSCSSEFEKKELAEKYTLVVEKKIDNLLRVSVLIEQLISLSKERIVRSITLPDKPTKLRGGENEDKNL